ncbi:hypothetical protein EQ500_09405 [Lactobacillus sp. XV13L]|nr:hypothetical protein [Lactobacillus sp. XV13L]
MFGKKLANVPGVVFAIGDEQNDVPLFKFVGTAVVMDNGSDLAKEHANYVTAGKDAVDIEQSFKFTFN